MVTLRFTFRIHSDLWSYVGTSRSQKLKSHLSAEPLPVGSWVHRIKNIPHGRLSKSASWPLTLDDIQEVISRSTSGKIMKNAVRAVLRPNSTAYRFIDTWTPNSRPILKPEVESHICNRAWLACDTADIVRHSLVTGIQDGGHCFRFQRPPSWISVVGRRWTMLTETYPSRVYSSGKYMGRSWKGGAISHR